MATMWAAEASSSTYLPQTLIIFLRLSPILQFFSASCLHSSELAMKTDAKTLAKTTLKVT